MLLARFRGRWAMRRAVLSAQGAELARVDRGEAVYEDVEPDLQTEEQYAGHLLYSESGDLHLPAARAPTRMNRQYLWSFTAEGDCIDVRFYHAPGVADHLKFFHRLELPPGAEVATATHLCEADLYSGEVRLEGEGRFVQTWTVKGPAKDYVSTTEFWRDS